MPFDSFIPTKFYILLFPNDNNEATTAGSSAFRREVLVEHPFTVSEVYIRGGGISVLSIARHCCVSTIFVRLGKSGIE